MPASHHRFVHTACGACGLALLGTLAGCGDAGSRSSAQAERTVPVLARFVRLEQVSETNGQPWGSVAEFEIIDSTGATVDRTGWVATADSASASDPPSNAVDGRAETFWHSRWEGAAPPPPPHALTISLPVPINVIGFRYTPRRDAVGNGTFAKYRFYLSNDGTNWGQPVAEGDFAMLGPPREPKTVTFARATENRAPVITPPAAQRSAMGKAVALDIAATDADKDPVSYAATGLPPGLHLDDRTGRIAGTPIAPGAYSAAITARDNKGLEARAALQWTVDPPAPLVATVAAAVGEARFVKFEQLSEVTGKPWASVAELKLLDRAGAELPRTGWTASADSADAADQPVNAIDGNPASIWHSQWNGASPPPPHALIVDLGKPLPVRGFRYLPRQDRSSNGIVARYRFYTSADGVNWGSPLAEGDLAAMGRPDEEKTVLFK